MKHGSTNTTVSVAVLTVSDTRIIDDDQSGAMIVDGLVASGHSVVCREIVQDDQTMIAKTVTSWANERSVQAIIVTGGTGPGPRDVTPDAILPLMSSILSGFGELFRHLSYKEIGAAAMLSRAEAGWIDTDQGRKPIFLLPGSPNSVQLAMDTLILPQLGHFLDVCSVGVQS